MMLSRISSRSTAASLRLAAASASRRVPASSSLIGSLSAVTTASTDLWNTTNSEPSSYRRWMSSKSSPKSDHDNHNHSFLNNDHDTIIPGASGHNYYGSLGDPIRKPNTSTQNVAWQAQHNSEVQRVTQKAMIYELCSQQTQTIEKVVPWFLSNMPQSYFRQVPESFRLDHIKAIAAVQDANMDMYLNLKSHTHDGREILTFIRPGTKPGTLLSMVEELPPHTYNRENLTRLHVFSALDDSLSLNMFVFGNKKPKVDGTPGSSLTPDYPRGPSIRDELLEYGKKVQAGKVADIASHPLFEPKPLKEFLDRCGDNYLHAVSNFPERFFRQRLMFDRVSGTEGSDVHIESTHHIEEEAPGTYWIDVAVANSLPQTALENTLKLLYLHKFDVQRARLDVIPDDNDSNVTMIRMLVTILPEALMTKDRAKIFELLTQELKRSKWLDPTTMDLVFHKYPGLGVQRGEIITAMTSLMHPVLAKENALVYSKGNILEMVTQHRYIDHASKIADLFLERFNPTKPLSDVDMKTRIEELTRIIDSDVEDTIASGLLKKMMDIVTHTKKTNIYMENRFALSLRLDPKIMGEPVHGEMPYGIFFVHGRRFNGYHVRFRDISRGGMRLVTPATSEQYALESARQYDECYGLAFAQQLKNKDIPEGGSKAVVLINTNEIPAKSKGFVMRKSVKAFTDSILDVIVDTEETNKNIVDLLGKKEVLYLGPDEQVIPEDINWIIKRAALRGYGTPQAFMSSKPRAGINHKEFGVTSEGVNVYLDVALRRALNIDPTKDTFTIKMTGGPDGDVGGNEIKILIREYGENVKIVGIADHSGCAEDPNGLNHDELLRLFHEGLCISNFSEDKLSEDGVLHTVETEEGVKARNSMHNRLEADAFVPCGGRPNTIDITNYKQFIKEDGKPSAPLIVEGANLFVTAEARQALHDEAGVVIVKDSSANKGGVITSSYEICAAMLVGEDEFFAHKEPIVKEVLAKLRELARMEAELLFRESENYGVALPQVSQIVSNAINAATDALSGALDTLSEQDREQLLPLFRAHLPKTLADLSFDQVHKRVPDQYIKNAISSCLASKMVYKEGTKFIDAQPKHKLAQVALKYIEKEKEVAALMELMKTSNIPEEDKEKILKLLDAGGARTALGL